MNEGSFIALIGGALFAFSVSFLCSLMEASMLSLSPGELAKLEKRKQKIGNIVRGFKEQIELPVTVILSINTIAHTVGATIVGAETAMLFGEKYIGITSGVFTYIMLQFTEILPKSLGVHYNIKIAELSAVPLSILIVILRPVIKLLRFINKPFEKKKPDNDTGTLDEINALASHAQLEKQISKNQVNIIKGVTLLSSKKAEDLMIPVDQLTFLSKAHTLTEAIIKAHLDPHTRFPVIEGENHDIVVGYVNFKELVYRMRTNPADPTLAGIIRPLRFVNKDTSCQQLLKVFVDEHEHMALVQDNTQHTIGLITLEDVVEELVGEIEDEFDKLPKNIHMLNQGVWIVGGGVSMRSISEKLGRANLLCGCNISDWIINRMGHMPAIDERIKAEGHEFNVRRLRRGKVFEVLITPESISAPSK